MKISKMIFIIYGKGNFLDVLFFWKAVINLVAGHGW